MIIDPALADVDPLRAALRADIRADETEIVRRLAREAALPEAARARVAARFPANYARLESKSRPWRAAIGTTTGEPGLTTELGLAYSV